MHTQIGIFELQMSLMYNARDSHCFFIDQKANTKVAQAVNGIIKCYKEKFHEVQNIVTLIASNLIRWNGQK
jgi:hypothetical protein